VIGRHIRNIFKEGELEEALVCAEFAHTTQHGAIPEKTQSKTSKYYNLDVIISVGYRVKSIRGTQFRQWANTRIKEILIQGYSINARRLEQKKQEIKVLKSGLIILGRALEESAEEAGLSWLSQFSKGLTLLDDFDHERLDQEGLSIKAPNYPTKDDYNLLIGRMKVEFKSGVFGLEKDKSFESAINQITKGFDDFDFYPSIEEKAATLLYLIVKNHPFTDGNKRIAAACFLLFLEFNGLLFNHDGSLIISNEALASLTLFAAASKADEMEIVKKLIVSILNRNKF
jgi:death-on-curing family protein